MFANFRISTKLLLTILPLIILAVGISAYFNNRYQEREMLKQAQAAARTYSDLVRESIVYMMITHNKVEDDYFLQLNNVREIGNLHIHFNTDSLHLRETYSRPERFSRLRARQKGLRKLSAEEQLVFDTGEPLWQRNGRTINALIPFMATNRCQNCHDVPSGFILGAAEMDISLDRISASIESNWIRSIWIVYIFTSIALFLSIVLYRLMVSTRMKHLVEATKIIGEGNLEYQIPAGKSKDELGELATAFDTMRTRLRSAQDRLIHAERLSALGQMASSIIHDFRTPMSTINLVVESLQQGKPATAERIQEWYRIIRESVQRMVGMAQELLDFSRGEIHLEKTEFSVDEFIVLLVKSVKLSLERAKITLRVEKRYAGPAVFDPDRLHRAFVNIINNAQDAMPTGGTVLITSTRVNGSVAFDISDTGKGIPPEIQGKIFDAFVTAGKKKGTGLGLAITKRIIDQHGGTIEVESVVGKGTTFKIKLPMK